MAAVLSSWTVQHLRKDLEKVSNEPGKYLQKNLPAEEGGSKYRSPGGGGSKPGTIKDSREAMYLEQREEEGGC